MMLTPYIAKRRQPLTGQEYEAVCCRIGFAEFEVADFCGRLCIVTDSYRRHAFPGSNLHARVQIRFLDSDERISIPAGEWARKAKIPPLSVAA
jgi:hypothetical protein